MGVGSDSDRAAIDYYNLVYASHDKIMESLGVEGYTEFNENNIPMLSHAKIAVIIKEKIEPFLQKELEQVVSNILYSCHYFSPLSSTAWEGGKCKGRP